MPGKGPQRSMAGTTMLRLTGVFMRKCSAVLVSRQHPVAFAMHPASRMRSNAVIRKAPDGDQNIPVTMATPASAVAPPVA